jgi:NAD dependent epimerase/dehydratase family enzyme
LLLTGQRVLPAHALAEGFTFHFPTLEMALDDLLST